MRSHQTLFEQLEEQGWAVSDDLIPAHLQQSLYVQSQQLWQAGQFHDARIGRNASNTARSDIRGDSICWLDPLDPLKAHLEFSTWADKLRHQLNERYYLGLRSEEFHFARYAQGQGYKKHFDQHQGSLRRKISLVLYLNPQWGPGDGGELCIFAPDNDQQEVQRTLPQPARLVVFRSDLIAHEVLPAQQIRWSLTGWFRTDAAF